MAATVVDNSKVILLATFHVTMPWLLNAIFGVRFGMIAVAVASSASFVQVKINKYGAPHVSYIEQPSIEDYCTSLSQIINMA